MGLLYLCYLVRWVVYIMWKLFDLLMNMKDGRMVVLNVFNKIWVISSLVKFLVVVV